MFEIFKRDLKSEEKSAVPFNHMTNAAFGCLTELQFSSEFPMFTLAETKADGNQKTANSSAKKNQRDMWVSCPTYHGVYMAK